MSPGCERLYIGGDCSRLSATARIIRGMLAKGLETAPQNIVSGRIVDVYAARWYHESLRITPPPKIHLEVECLPYNGVEDGLHFRARCRMTRKMFARGCLLL